MIFKFILILVYKKIQSNYIISDYVIAPALDDPLEWLINFERKKYFFYISNKT